MMLLMTSDALSRLNYREAFGDHNKDDACMVLTSDGSSEHVVHVKIKFLYLVLYVPGIYCTCFLCKLVSYLA